MKKLLLLFSILALLSVSAYSQTIPEGYTEAMTAFTAGDYARAYGLFEKFYQMKGVDDELSSSAKYYSAISLLRLNQPDAAAAALEFFTSKYTESNFRNEALYQLGTLYFKGKEYAKSREKLQMLVEDYPESEYVGSSMYLIGDSYAQEGSYNEAIKYFENAISTKENNKYIDNSIYSLANIYEKTGDYKHAVAYYDSLLAYYKSSPLAPHAQIRIGFCYFKLKEYDNVVLELNDPLIGELPPQLQTEAKYILANSYYRLKEYDDAGKTYSAILKKDPGTPLIRDVKYGLAWVYFQRAMYDEAYKTFSSLAREGGNDTITVKSLFWSAECKRYEEKDNEALLIYDDFLNSYQNSTLVPQVKYLIGVIKYGENKGPASEEYLLSAAKSDDELVRGKALVVLGELNLNKKDYRAANKNFNEAVSIQGLPADLSSRALLGLGTSDYYLNQYDEAIRILNRLNSQAPGFEGDKVHFYTAESYFAKKDFKQALKQYNAIDTNKKELTDQVFYGKAYTYFNLKDFPNSSYYFSEFIKRYKNSPNITDAKLRLADSYYGEKKFNDAGRIYKDVFLSNGSASSDYAYYQYAQALYKAGNTSEAIKEFATLQDKFPDSKYVAESQYIIGWIYFQKGNFTQAISNYDRLLTTYPNSSVVPIAFNSIGNSYFNLGKYDSAIVYYNKVINGYPTSNYVYDAVMGVKDAFMANDQPDNAVQFIDSYVASNPAVAFADQVYFKKGEIYFNLRNYDKAKQSYKEFIRQFPKSTLVPEAYYAIGKSAEIMNQNEEALYNFNMVFTNFLTSEPGVASVLEMGKIHTDLKNYDAAIKIYDTAIDKYPPESPKVPEIMYNRAMACIAKGDVSKAYDDFNYLIQYYSNSIFAANAKFEIALVEVARKNYETSDMLLKELSENRTDDLGAKAQYYYGISLFDQNKLDDAISALVRVKFAFAGYDEWLTNSYLKLGECYEKKQDTEKAKEMYRIVINRHRNDQYGIEAQNKLRALE